MKLMDGFDSNYRYILVAARRARQLQGGAGDRHTFAQALQDRTRRNQGGQSEMGDPRIAQAGR